MASIFDIFGPPPSPEQRLEHQKRVVGTCEAVLPLIREARARLRDVRALGVSMDDLVKAQNHLAVLEDDIESTLAVSSARTP